MFDNAGVVQTRQRIEHFLSKHSARSRAPNHLPPTVIARLDRAVDDLPHVGRLESLYRRLAGLISDELDAALVKVNEAMSRLEACAAVHGEGAQVLAGASTVKTAAEELNDYGAWSVKYRREEMRRQERERAFKRRVSHRRPICCLSAE